MGKLAGKVAIITGSGTGIGRAAAELFGREGARVILAEISEETGQALADRIVGEGGEARFVHTDMTDPRSVSACVEAAQNSYGRLDVLYNNVGGSTAADGFVTETADAEFWRCMTADLFSVWLGCKYGIPAIKRAGGGSVINTTSSAAVRGVRGRDAYCAAKGGVISLTRSMALEYAPDNVRINAIAPGATRTERLLRILEEPNLAPPTARSTPADGKVTAESIGQILGFVEPEEVASLALYLASDAARRITGQILSVDSGQTL